MSDTEERDEPVVCLACGKVVVESGPPPAGEEVCTCHAAEPLSAGSIRCPSCGGSLAVGARACPYCHSAVATQRCNACLAWNLSGAKHCHDCGADLAADGSVAGQRVGKSCPRCAGALVLRRYADLRVNECDACGGMMLDVEMMSKIVETRDKSTALRLALPERATARETEVHYLTCPFCAKSMNRKAFGKISGVVVDVCKQDGVWFDAGELAAVLAFVARGGLEEARKRELDEIRESKRALHAAELHAEAAVSKADPRWAGESVAGGRLEGEILAAFKSLWS